LRRTAIFEAARQALPGTLAAAATASAAYAGLAASTFRGFSQFGWIGGVGMVTTWLAMFITMPIAIGLFNPPRFGERPTATQAWLHNFFRHRTLPWLATAAFILISGFGALLGVRTALTKGLYEMDVLTLRNRDSLRSGAGSWDNKRSEVFGVWLNPVAAVVDDPANREATATALRSVLLKGSPSVAQRVDTIDMYVPVLAKQEERLARSRKIAASIAKIPREEIPEKARPFVDSWFANNNLKPITVADVPQPLKQNFIEKEAGRTDRVVLVFPNLAINYNDGRNIIHFADVLHSAPMPADATVGGSFLFMAEIIKLVTSEAPHVVLVVCLLVAAVLIPFFLKRPLRIFLVVGTVAIVAVTAQAVMLALGVKLNMLNFAAVPITIGIGADYVVNLIGVMDAFAVDARRACVKMGGAIFLCSLTTIVGYLSLVMAQSGALRTFGWAAVLGEVMAVAVVLLVLPVLMPSRPEL
jgi:predicted exporter